MPIYTRTGDEGTTALYGGKRVLKCDELVEVYGSIDELNSWIGLINSKQKVQKIKKFLTSVQLDLFQIGSVMAGWKGDLTKVGKRVEDMERLIDEMGKQLPDLSNFILPGGSEDGSNLHIARSICRRVERQMVRLEKQSTNNFSTKANYKVFIKYLNRLSDLFFMTARFINKKQGFSDIVWSGISKIDNKK